MYIKTYVEISPGLVLPVISFSQASAHSRTMSVAYLSQSVSVLVWAEEIILLILTLSSESKLVFWLSVWDLVDSEPFICSSQETRKVSFNILDIIEFRCQWVVDINHNDLPVSLFFIKQSHNTKDLDLLDLSWVADQFADLTDIQWIIVTLGFRLRMDDVGILPCLQDC
jgi:hypothetical protein